MSYETLLVGFVIGAALMYAVVWFDRFIFGTPPAERTLERAKRERFFREVRREARRQEEERAL